MKRLFPMAVGLLFAGCSSVAEEVASTQQSLLSAAALGQGAMKAGDGSAASGTRPLLVALMVDQANPTTFPSGHDVAYYQNLAFGPNGRNIKSYFSEISGGAFAWSNASVVNVGTVALDRSAVLAALIQNKGAAFFQGLDTDHNGVVTQGELGVLVFYASSTQASNGQTAGGFASASGVTISTSVSMVASQTDFSTDCHEVTHQLGAIDMYRDSSCYYGTTIMGCTGGPLDNMAIWHPDPWHKLQLGWEAPTIHATSEASWTATLSNGHSVIQYDIGEGAKHFYVIEKRTKQGYDADTLESGIRIWSVEHNDALHGFVTPSRYTINGLLSAGENMGGGDLNDNDFSVWSYGGTAGIGGDTAGNYDGTGVWPIGATVVLSHTDGTPFQGSLHIDSDSTIRWTNP